VQQALQQMRAHSPSTRTTGMSIKNASQHRGPWPPVSIWHGTADAVVSPSNADALVQQWKEVHGALAAADEEGLVDGHQHRAWRDADGKLLLEEYRISGMGHGAPLATQGACGCGEAGAFMLEVGISSTVHSAKTWGLLIERRSMASYDAGCAAQKDSRTTSVSPDSTAPAAGGPDNIRRVIEDALRSAGLMR
jgi:poly(3-hydroxybutyrate) depolymerase